MEPSLYERIGDEGILLLTTLFYDRVFSDDDEQWFMNIFSSSTKQEAIDNQVCVCVCVCMCLWTSLLIITDIRLFV